MQVTQIHKYDHDLEKVFKFFGDADASTEKQKASGCINIDINSDINGGNMDVVIKKEQPADPPKVLKKFIKPYNKIEQVEHWVGEVGGTRTAEMTIHIHGVPVKMNGHMELSATDTGCQNKVTMDITCGIPLVGKKLAEFTGGITAKQMEDEYELIKKMLVDYS